ncbi:non-ribosomal peptide synthetase [Streptomyces triticirhizae]|uniref:Amino acid adenylation domain-containing protein n=1 Tax=Streptomyces triticirhizae TaxID=2483353 RepID=A0A3M2M1I2_9ACTN|nr:non-ribosomal peptide synthetase [Streptomyces triticirhizae]RMI43396.1 amino acid adenylation domain-containing protein [Streptomyces triticirhizae]
MTMVQAPAPVSSTGGDLLDVLTRGADRHADRVAVRDADGTVLTHRELWAAARAEAAGLVARGTGPEDRVGVLAERTAGTVVAVLAVLLTGAAYVPVDPATPRERREESLTRAGVREVVDGARLGRVPRHPEDHAGGRSTPVPAASLAYVLHTSGSTGQPKGVMIERGSVASFVTAARELFAVTAEDRVLQFSSFAFDTSVFEVFTALAAGAELVVAGRAERSDVFALARMIRDHGVTVADIPPSVLELIDPAEVPGLRLILSGGEPCSGALAERWAPSVRFWHGYGPTETTVAAAAGVPDRGRAAGMARVPLGEGIGEAELRVVDAHLAPVGDGSVGELCVGGPVVGRGYWRAPAATALAFVPDPEPTAPGARLYRTGDMVRRDAHGQLLYLSRRDRQVKVNGVRVEPGEIETVLRRDPAVRQALVDAFEVRGRELLAAVVTGRGLDAAEVRARLAAWFPTWMVPERVLVLDAMPRTLTDKVDRLALTTLLEGEAPGAAGSPGGLDGFTALEHRVATELFAPALGSVPASPLEDYFGMGGNSLEAIRMLAAVPEIFGVEVPVADFIADSSVAAVARAVAGAQRNEAARDDG